MEVCNSDIRGGVCDKGRWVYDEGKVGALWVKCMRVSDREQGLCAYDTKGQKKRRGVCVTQVWVCL